MVLRLRTLDIEASVKKIGNGHTSHTLGNILRKCPEGYFSIK